SRFYSFSKMFDIYVNDAFSVCHRNHGSIVIPPKEIPACIGEYFHNEISILSKYKENKKKSGLYLLGGEKAEDYLSLFNVLKNKNNKIIVSGVLANLILISIGFNLGYENIWMRTQGYNKLMPKLRNFYKKYSNQIILPIDFAIGNKSIQSVKERKEYLLSDIPFKGKIWDIGHESINIFNKEIEKADFIFMKGPVGYSEVKYFKVGTVEILKKISKLSKNKRVISLIGGGHLTMSIRKYKIPNHFSHISLEGGALIAYLSGKKLPGLDALKR
ncbi:MAG: phosphoglycerate kinase, partial [Nanoarchaeota archaeon]